MAHESKFRCPLPNGLHARPASMLSEVAGRFASDITLENERTSASANAKSVLALVSLDLKAGDACRVRVTGTDEASAHAAMRAFIDDVMPACDEALAPPVELGDVKLPRVLLECGVRWQKGIAVCPGIGRGPIVLLGGITLPTELVREPARPRDHERERVKRATDAVRAALQAKLAAGAAPIEAAVLGAHLSIASDVGLAQAISERIERGHSAGQAIAQSIAFFADRLKSADSAYVRERATDVEDIGLQLLEQVYGERFRARTVELTAPSVVAAETLTPRQFVALDKRFVQALLVEQAGVTSHAMILARSFGIPTLTDVPGLRSSFANGQDVIVDSNLGIVIGAVTPAVDRHYRREVQKLERRRKLQAVHADAPAVTRDGVRIEVAANVSTADEIAPAFAHGADGIGLFRTEMLFMDRAAAPSEEEQLAVYAQAARAASGRPVILRTFDVGGDKPVPYLELPAERNPFLGYRGARVYPAHEDVFRAQVRAIARASAFGRVWLMLPMISTIDEVRWARERIASVQSELAASRVAFDPSMRVGVMVEVPSVAFAIDRLAAEVDFFSIGTNDLTQYFFAVDRESEKVASLSNARAISSLRLLSKISTEARAARRFVGTCGEMARDPLNLPLLIGLDLDEISTAAPEIPAAKAAIARYSAAECRDLYARAQACATAAEVDVLVSEFRRRANARPLLEIECVAIDSDSASKAEAIDEIVGAFHATGRTEHPLAVEEAVWARESVYSTGLGHGFAIPHCKTDAIAASSIGVVRLAQPIEWASLDGEPVRCVILLAMRASDEDGTHMKVFAKLARKLMHEDFRARMLSAPDADAVVACMTEELG